MINILKDLCLLNRVFCSSDYDKCIKYLQNILPFEVVSFGDHIKHNGWTIPPKWDVKEAKIFKDGKVLYDGLIHPLRVISLSKSFNGKVSLNELKNHLHYDSRYNDSVPFHFRQQYSSHNRDWGFCVSKDFFDSLTNGEYNVVIETEESNGVLKILDYTHEGLSNKTFVFVAHLDHPGMANDDLSACAAGIEVFKRLKGKNTKHSYKLLLVQEIIGSEYYLGVDRNKSKDILESIFIEMVGSKTPLSIQSAFTNNSSMEAALVESMGSLKIPFDTGAFRTIIRNDECVWESYGIPMPVLSRFPYPEYHSDKDDISIISEDSLNETVDILLGTIKVLEKVKYIYKKFSGNICLSNPECYLYIDPGQYVFGGMDPKNKKIRLLIDTILVSKNPIVLKDLSAKTEFSEEDILIYLQKWIENDLIEIV